MSGKPSEVSFPVGRRNYTVSCAAGEEAKVAELGADAYDNELKYGDAAMNAKEVDLLNAYWRASNYLSVGQIYLLSNPLLRVPLQAEHVKPRLLGHWGTTPGLNFLYVHLNRLIKARGTSVLYIAGPGHG